MPSSNITRGWLLALAVSLPASADQLVLPDDARLTGRVVSINNDGGVELSSELSSGPIMLKPEAVRKLTFAESNDGSEIPVSMVELVNGDLLPVSIGSFDGEVLSVTTQDAGPLSIPRKSLKSIQLGIRKQKSIYSGPKSVDEWNGAQEGAKNWLFTKGALSSSSLAVASKMFDLPSRFVLKFNLKWQASPNFMVYLADPLTPRTSPVDRYSFQFNASGIEIKRESSAGQRTQPVILLARNPDDFPANQLDVEIRVDRKSSRIHLLLNGEPEAAGIDPVANAPEGAGVVFISSSPSRTLQEIRSIELLDFDDSKERHRSEERGDPTMDSVISRVDDRCGGRLTSIQPGNEGTVFTFKSDFQEAPLELLESDISTVFFAKPTTDEAAPNRTSWVLKLRGGGSLQMGSCVFSEKGVTAVHPLLGALEIGSGGVTELEHLLPKTETKPEE
jgi:hypothetical protein